MIPLFLLKYWRVGAAVGVVIVIALMGWRVSAWHTAYEALPGVRDALEREEGCLDGSKCAERVAALRASQAAVEANILQGYEHELAALRDRPVPSVPVRLCRPANRGPVRDGAAAPATGPGDGPDVPLEAGRDIAVELYRLADDADAEALKLRALWDRDVALASDGAAGK